MNNPNGYVVTIKDLDEKQRDALQSGGIAVVLTPDDIITLKLARESEKEYLNSHRTNESQRLIETLERILNQIH